MSLIRRDGEGIISKGLFKFLDGGVVGRHGWGRHDRHFVGFDAELTSNAVELMDGDAHDAGCGVDSWSLRERVG